MKEKLVFGLPWAAIIFNFAFEISYIWKSVDEKPMIQSFGIHKTFTFCKYRHKV